MSRWRPRAWLGGAQRRLTALAVLAAVAIMGLFALGGIWTYLGPGPKAKNGEITTVMLEKGLSVRQIAAALGEAGVISSPSVFVAAARITEAAAALKAGEYDFRSSVSMASVLSDVRAGRVVRHLVTIPEGWTSGMAVEAVNRQPVLTGFAETPPEGAILPDTYQVHRGQPREEVIAEMRAARDRLLAELWASRQPGLPISTPEEAVTLASIVEKETGLASERPRIAAVFMNRLRKSMRLESDPTIIYGISKGRPLGRGLTASEVATKTPYNTYRVDGLPPTPIANPGRQALEAVLNPPQSDELFFVADGTGGHVFASTYDEHLRNVARWRQVERAQATAGGR